MGTFRYLRLAAFVTLPPVIGTALAFGLDVAGGGQARCFAELDVATAPVVCLPGLTLVVMTLAFIGIHLLVALPLSWWAAKRGISARALLTWLGAGVVVLLAPLTLARGSDISIGRAVWENYATLGLPLFALLATAVVLGRHPMAHSSGSPMRAAA